MKRPVFKATIKGYKYVRMTGPIRVPTSFRVRIYADGEVVISTRGYLGDAVCKSPDGFDNGPVAARQKLLEQTCAKLGKLALESQQLASLKKK